MKVDKCYTVTTKKEIKFTLTVEDIKELMLSKYPEISKNDLISIRDCTTYSTYYGGDEVIEITFEHTEFEQKDH